MGRQRSVQVVVIIAIYLSIASHLPLVIHQGLYTISLFMKDLLLWLLPVTVSLFIAHAIAAFEKKAPLFICSLLIFEALSNSISVWYSFVCGHLTADHVRIVLSNYTVDTLDPLWRLPLTKPSWWTADKGTFAGLVLGLITAFITPTLSTSISKGKECVEYILTRVFSRFIPLFVLGFIARMYATQLLHHMTSQYATFFLWLVFYSISYVIFLFLLGNNFSLKRTCKSIKNLVPATSIAFSSGCSISTMPSTILGTSKNLDNPDFAQSVIPATTNIQQIGDCIAQSFLCFFIYLHFNGQPPSLYEWSLFSSVFVLARFATAAVLGGAIFIMLPIYEAYLHFTPEMIALILALNVILDPLITCTNVAANGALCQIFEKMWLRLLRYVTLKEKS